MSEYFHGYSEREFRRLIDQSLLLADQIYPQLHLPEEGKLLEPGCGVGAQTRVLAEKFPGLNITGVDVDEAEIARANDWLNSSPELKERIEFIASDYLKFESEELFDAAFICWLLEHVADPLAVLVKTKDLLRPEGGIFITEVLNNTLHLYPKNAVFEKYWEAYCRHQLEVKGNPYIGAQLRNLLTDAGFSSIEIMPHFELFDKTDRDKLNDIANYWLNLLDSVGDKLEEKRYVTSSDRQELKAYLSGFSLLENAVFFYTFIQAEAIKES